MTEGRARTVFIGSGGFGVPSLGRLATHPSADIVGVVTAPARPAGRRQEPKPTPIELAARSRGLEPILTPARLREHDAIERVLALEPSIAVLVDYGQIVPGEILDLPHGALNLHPSLLPRHRGATPIPAAILADDSETGVTLFRMDDGLDTGPIIASRTASLDGTDTAADLSARLQIMAADLLADTFDPWMAGDVPAVPQDAEGATMTRPLKRDDGRLDPSKPAVELERQVRAYVLWPGSFFETPKGRMIVHAASVDRSSTGAVGSVDEVGLNTVAGRLAFRTVQPAGGRVMPWREYLRGGARIVGSSIVP